MNSRSAPSNKTFARHRGRKGHVALPSALVVISCLILLPTAIYPYGRDQGIFGYAGHMVLQGGVPFRDFWDPKPPALYYTYALAELLFGYSMSSIRVFDLIIQVAVSALLYAITRRLTGKAGTAFLAGALYILAYASRGWWNTAQPEDFLNLPLTLSVLLIVRGLERQRASWLTFLAGGLIAVAFYFKYPMGGMLIACAAVLLASRGANRRAAAEIASMTCGFMLLAGAYALHLRGVGAWREFFYAQFVWPREYVAVGASPRTLAGLLHLGEIANSHFSFLCLASMAVGGYIGAVRAGRCQVGGHLVALWALVALLNLYLQNKFYIYHFAPLLPPCAIGASCAVAYPLSRGIGTARRLASAFAVLAAVVFSFLMVNPRYNSYCVRTYIDSAEALGIKVAAGAGLDEYYMNVRFTSDDFSLPADLVVAQYLSNHTTPDDTVFIWGYETIVYYLARRTSASRFVHNFPLRCAWVPDRFGAELLSDLQRRRPRYIALVRNDQAWWATGNRDDSLAALNRYPDIGRFMDENYAFERAIEDFLIFRKRG